MKELENLNLTTYCKLIANETAKNSYQGSMSRGKNGILKAESKKRIQKFFVDEIALDIFWEQESTKQMYREWHCSPSKKLAKFLMREGLFKNTKNTKQVVAAKFIDTFMHSLLRYRQFEELRRLIHLPLDNVISRKFRKKNNWMWLTDKTCLQHINEIFKKKSAYEISPMMHIAQYKTKLSA